MSEAPLLSAGRALRGLSLLAVVVLAGAPGRAAAAPPEPPALAPPLPPGIVRDAGGYRSERDGMELVLVPAREFRLGSDDGAFDERPAHAVALSAYLLDRTEVSNAQFERFVRAGTYRPQGPWRRGAGPGLERHPVRFVTWYDASAYAAWAGRRLPTEAQWERAARGLDGRRYPWGSAWRGDAAVADLPLDAGPLAVGSRPLGASPVGALDLAGNVWEWTADWYDRRAYEARAGREPVLNPTGPADGAPPEERFVKTGTAGGNERSTRKVVKGGAWFAGGAETTRASKRVALDPRAWFNDTGFRCAVPMP